MNMFVLMVGGNESVIFKEDPALRFLLDYYLVLDVALLSLLRETFSLCNLHSEKCDAI